MVARKYGLNLACMCWKIWAGSSLQLLENMDWIIGCACGFSELENWKKKKSSLHVDFLFE